MNDIHYNGDPDTPISFFKKEVDHFIVKRNWTKYHTPKNLIQAIQIEAAELSEIFLFKDFKKEDIMSDKKLLGNISDEISDVFIYLISLINALGLDLTEILVNKMEKNRAKYTLDEFNSGVYFKK